MNWIFGVAIHKEGNDFAVIVRDLPEVVTAGRTLPEALELAADGIEVVVGMRLEDERELSEPTAVEQGEYAVPLEPRLAAKASIYALWRAANITKSELARRMGRNEAEVRRVLDPAHGTKLDQLQDAARAMGSSLIIGTAPLIA